MRLRILAPVIGLTAFSCFSGFAQTAVSTLVEPLAATGVSIPATSVQDPTPGTVPDGDFLNRGVLPAGPTIAPLRPIGAISSAKPVGDETSSEPLHEDLEDLRISPPSPVKGKLPTEGSPYIPVDSWVYPEILRLHGLGYIDTPFLNMRPWTRQSVLHMLDAAEDDIRNGDSEEAKEILAALNRELREESAAPLDRGAVYGTKSVYTRVMGISGITLRDSYHIGQTIENDYGRPYQPGFNNITGFSTIAEKGRFSFFFRGEYQHSPSAAGYSQALTAAFSKEDLIPYSGFNLNQATIPTGPIGSQNPFRVVDATLSVHLLGHEISGGKSDAWLGPAQGGALLYSNNAENIYSFRIDRVEPLYIPFLSRLTGPVRYEIVYGSLKGHTDPNSPYVHTETFAFDPTSNFEFSFGRTVIFGGEGHVPVTIHTFLRSFFSINDLQGDFQNKFNTKDPGARFSDFGVNYRLPFMRKSVSFYVDSFVHDDITPPDAPRRAAFRTGLYLSHFKFQPKLDLRVEAADTDCRTSRCQQGLFYYFESAQVQGYTNKGFIFGDPIGREGKGGHAWLTYHLSGNESIGIEYMNKKNDNDFIAQGTTQNDFKATVTKRFLNDSVEVNGWVQYERWKAPIYLPGQRNDTTTAVQVTFFPGLKTKPTN